MHNPATVIEVIEVTVINRLLMRLFALDVPLSIAIRRCLYLTAHVPVILFKLWMNVLPFCGAEKYAYYVPRVL